MYRRSSWATTCKREKKAHSPLASSSLTQPMPSSWWPGSFEKLDEYVELELQGTHAEDRIPGMRAHLEGCPACHEEYASLRELVQNEPNT
jgi:hypothetical protein